MQIDLKKLCRLKINKEVEEFTLFKLMSIIQQLPLKLYDDLPIFIPH